jgi:predicted metal-binding protein
MKYDRMNNQDKIERVLSSLNLHDFRWINPEEIVVAQWVRVKCLFGCGDYGLGACPPNTPSVEECDRFFKEYKSALIIRFSQYADRSKYPSQWSAEMTTKLLELERSVFLMGFQKAFLLNQTCCDKCSDCSGNRSGCKDKKLSRPSPEAFAVDVYQTVRKAGWEISVVSENPASFNRIAILMVE